jgi:hypothetical protein
MKIIIGGYFDVGFSIGIDDYLFKVNQKVKKISDETRYKITFNNPPEAFRYSEEAAKELTYSTDDAEGHIGMSVPVGSGLIVDLSTGELLQLLHKEALEAASNKKFMGEYYTDPPENIVEIIRMFQSENGFKKATANLFGLGIGYLYLETDDLSERIQDYALWIYRCYEYATYGTYSTDKFRETFKMLIIKIYAHFSGNENIHEITRRKIPCDFFPGYQLILLCSNNTDGALAAGVLKNYEEFTSVQMDDGLVKLAWAAVIVEPSNNYYYSRMIFLLKMAQVYYGICDGFERLFAHHISESVRQNLTDSASAYDAVSLNRLRTIAHTVAEFTRFRALTQNSSDFKLLSEFDRLGDFSSKIDHLVSVCEIFTNIQNEIIEQKQSKRDKRLNVYAMALTALTIVSVTADMMSINEALSHRGWTILLKLIAIQGLLILIIYMAFEGKWKKKKKRDSGS